MGSSLMDPKDLPLGGHMSLGSLEGPVRCWPPYREDVSVVSALERALKPTSCLYFLARVQMIQAQS
jgi:hypothetical protein